MRIEGDERRVVSLRAPPGPGTLHVSQHRDRRPPAPLLRLHTSSDAWMRYVASTPATRATRHYALGAIFTDQLVVLQCHQQEANPRVGLKAFLRAA